MFRYSLAFFLGTLAFAQQPGTIQTIAGNGSAAFSGDGGPATQAALNVAVDVAADLAGNLFIADQFNHRIRKISTSGKISTVAGTGAAGFTGDGGPAVNAQLNTPTGIFVDPAGNLFIADVGNQRIRKVDTSGKISTIAGNGAKGYGGDGGLAVNATFYNCLRVAVDTTGRVLIADQSNHRVRRIDGAGIITTVAGNGVGTPATGAFSGDGGLAVDASLNNPTAIAVDPSGVIYIADQFNQRIRKVGTDGKISTIAGTGAAGYGGDGGPAAAALLNFPGAITLDAAGDIYFNDDVNYRTRMISTAGTISTVAGSGVQGFSGDGGPATSASLNGNFGVTLDVFGNLIIADSTNNRIREVFGAVPAMNPASSDAAFTNAASFVSGGSPGAFATLFGQHLTRNLNGILQSSTVPLPGSLAGTTVTVGGKTAPIFNVVNINGSEQISFQIPVDVMAGAAVPVVLNNGSGSVTIHPDLTAVQPGIFVVNGQAAALHLDFTLVTPSKPAAPGDTIILFCTGLGTVAPVVATGTAASATDISYSDAKFTATIAGKDAPVGFSGLAPGFVALGQINLSVPSDAPSGSQDLVISSGGMSSNAAKIQIK
jgi:uncharacterized protein (TIGR03437 family)